MFKKILSELDLSSDDDEITSKLAEKEKKYKEYKQNLTITVIPTKKDGDCALHALLGTWDEQEQQLVCKDAVQFRKRMHDAIVKSKKGSRINTLAIAGIKEIVMARCVTGCESQKLRDSYQQFITEKYRSSSQLWDAFENTLTEHQDVIDYVADNHKLTEDTSFRDQFYDALNRKEGELYGIILSISSLHKAFKDYNESDTRDYNWQISQEMMKEYTQFIEKSRQWLLMSEIAILAEVFNITVEYYPAPDAKAEVFNPSKVTHVLIQFDGRNHFERIYLSSNHLARPIPSLSHETQKIEENDTLEKLNNKESRERKSPICDEQLEKLQPESEIYNVFPCARFFTGRTDVIGELFNNFKKKLFIQVITGPGGIGKTQTALAYANHYREFYKDRIHWLEGETKASLNISYRNFAESLSIKTRGLQDKQICTMLKEKLLKESLILLIFDNASCFNDIEDYIPCDRHHVIITSRIRDWGSWETISLDLFSEKEASSYILDVLNGYYKCNENQIQADLLAKELEYLPLALAQAQAQAVHTIGKTNTIANYINLYRTNLDTRRDFLDKHVFFQDKYNKTVFNTWEVTKIKLETECPLSVDILKISTYYNPDKIPKDMLNASSNIEYLNAIDKLYDCSMIEIVDGNKKRDSYRIHRLLHQVIQLQLRDLNEEFCFFLRAVWLASQLFYKISPRHSDTYKSVYLTLHLESLLGHNTVLIKNSSYLYFHESKKVISLISSLFENLSDIYGILGNHQEKIKILESVLSMKKNANISGDLDIEVSRVLNNIAIAHGALGNHPQQKKYLIDSLTIKKQLLDDQHPKIGITLINLGIAHGGLKESQQRLDSLTDALKISRKVSADPTYYYLLGLNLTTLSNAYYDLKQYTKQKELLEEALSIKKLSYGENHLEVAITLVNLGIAHEALEDIVRAKKCYEDALKIYTETLGKDHFYTKIAQVNLSNLVASNNTPPIITEPPGTGERDSNNSFVYYETLKDFISRYTKQSFAKNAHASHQEEKYTALPSLLTTSHALDDDKASLERDRFLGKLQHTYFPSLIAKNSVGIKASSSKIIANPSYPKLGFFLARKKHHERSLTKSKIHHKKKQKTSEEDNGNLDRQESSGNKDPGL